MTTNGAKCGWPENVGIIAMEFVFPRQYVDQAELEKFDEGQCVDAAKGSFSGKYTIGLGQKEMSFPSDREDINSICLTAVSALVEKNQLKYSDIGRLEVGTETLIDKSKSVKTVLMDLFVDSGNFDVQGIDSKNACYGGTAALLNAIAWVESSMWDGRYAIAVAGDIAIYAKGNARPTGGMGAVAMLIGPNAPLTMERGSCATYMTNAYDFYKPDFTSEYPIVDGQLSIKCYFNALDQCYKTYAKKTERGNADLNHFDAIVFHTPFSKLVQKSVGRLLLNDFVSCKNRDVKFPGLENLSGLTLEGSLSDAKIERIFRERSADIYEEKTKNSLFLAEKLGNTYTASVFSCLISHLLKTPAEKLRGQRIGVFAYGSGLASSMYSFIVRPGTELDKMIRNLADIPDKLNDRVRVSPEEYAQILEDRAKSLHDAPFQPTGSMDRIFPQTWYLTNKDKLHRRTYSRK